MIGILGGMGTQAGLDFCNKLAILNRGKIDQEYPLFLLYNKSNIPGRPESIGIQTGNLSNKSTNKLSKIKYNKVLKSLLEGCKLLEKNKCKFIVIPCNTAHYWFEDFLMVELNDNHYQKFYHIHRFLMFLQWLTSLPLNFSYNFFL